MSETENISLEFTADEVKLLQSILKRDALLKSLCDTQKGLEDLNNIVSIVVPKPAKLILQWNDGLFKGWAKANSHLGAIVKSIICADITLAIAENTKNAAFFERLKSVRGCDD